MLWLYRCRFPCHRMAEQMTSLSHYVRRQTKEINSTETKEDTDTRIEGDRWRLPQKLCQHSNDIVSVVVIVDTIPGKPHIVRREMCTAYNTRHKPLIHKHL